MLRYYRSVDATITRSDTVRRVVARTRALDEDLLKGSSTVPYTAVVEELLDPRSNRTHGQVITAQRAEELELNIEHFSPDHPTWAMYWKLYCPSAVRSAGRNKKLFESNFVSLTIDRT